MLLLLAWTDINTEIFGMLSDWTNCVLGGSLIYAGIYCACVQLWSVANKCTATSNPWLSRKRPWCWFKHMARMDESADARRILGVLGKGWQDVLTPLGWPQLRTTYYTTTSVWKMPPSWHWTGHSGGYWQQVGLYSTEVVQAKQWLWWWWWWWWWWWCLVII